MNDQPGRRRAFALAAGSAAIIVALGGTSYAATRPSHHSAATTHHAAALSKHDVKTLIKGYVSKHVAQPIEFADVTDSSSGGGTVRQLGPWTLSVSCAASGVGVSVTGPGVVFGTNTLGATNGGAAASYETSGTGGGTNSAGTGFQASQTLVLLDNGTGYTVTYMANADTSSPVNCDLLGYAIPLHG